MGGLKKNLQCLNIEQKKSLINCNDDLSIIQQCELLNLNRSDYYYKPRPASKYDCKLLHQIDEIYTMHPYFGTRRMVQELADYNFHVGRDKIRSCYKLLGLEAIYPQLNLSKHNHQHKIYPYLLRDVNINAINHVWSADITYIRLKHGFVYLVAIMNWYSRFILDWQLSTTLHHDFCVEVLQNTLEKYTNPLIFNTDQGVQFTCNHWISKLLNKNIYISMDGRGRALDNIFIERFWRSLKQEKIYLTELLTVQDAKIAIAEYMEFYNNTRKHQSLNYKIPADIYFA